MEGFMKKKPVMGAMPDMETKSTMEAKPTMEPASTMETKSTMETNMYNLLMAARELGASDLHITVGIKPKCRIRGALCEMSAFEKIMPEKSKELVESMMKESQKMVMEERGELDFAYAINEVGRFRVNAFKQRGSYAAVLRLINTTIPSAESLGIPHHVVELTKKKRGLVLVTGPTGSGKSTTLASLIDIINSEKNVHIITLEDPIEYLHNHKKAIVNQREIGIDTDSYGAALRSALREDPDIILVGEMRDLDTISTAVTAAETGHLVFSTLHTIGAAPTIERIIDVYPPHQQDQIRVQLASVLEAVISQQLLPRADVKGRVAAFEVMFGTPAIKNLIREDKTHQLPSIIQTSKKNGMVTMDDSLFDLYIKHKISADSAVEFAQDDIKMRGKLF